MGTKISFPHRRHNRSSIALTGALLAAALGLAAPPGGSASTSLGCGADSCKRLTLGDSGLTVSFESAERYRETQQVCVISPKGVAVCRTLTLVETATRSWAAQFTIPRPGKGTWRTGARVRSEASLRVGPPPAIRVPVAGGALAGPGTVLYASMRACDTSKRPTRFRVRFHLFSESSGSLQKLAVRSVTTRATRPCLTLSGIPLKGDGRNLTGAFFVAVVQNLGTTRTTSVASDAPVGT